MSGLQRRRRAEADWFGREGIYTLEELAAMGYDTGKIDGQPPPAAPAPTPPAPTVAAAPTAPAGNWTWLLIGGLILAAVVAFND